MGLMDTKLYDKRIQDLIEVVLDQKRNMDDGVFESLEQLLKLAVADGDYALQGFVHFHMADAFYSYEVDYGKFRENLARAVYFFQIGGENELLARTFNYVAVDALNNGSYDVAYLYLMNAIQTCENVDNNYLLSIINNNIGQVFARMHSNEKAVEYVRLSNELQSTSNYDDYYYYQNMINGYFSEGVLCALMGDLNGAREANDKISKLEEAADNATISSVFIPISLLRLMIAILEGDKEQSIICSRNLIDKLDGAHRIFDFITDIEDLSYFLIEYDYLDIAREVLDIIKDTVMTSGVVQHKKIISALEIAYYEKIGDKEQVTAHLHEQYILSEQQQQEQNRIYQYSIDLINIMEEQRKEQEKMRQENERLQSQVQTDPLTGIPNRLMLDQSIPKLFEEAQNSGGNFAVSLMDIDKFKEYNDTYGHLAGDICLQKVAKAIETVSNKPGVHCARYGGDEFIMLYENKSNKEIMAIAEELRDTVYALDILHESMESGRVSISQGICNGAPTPENIQEEYLNEADNALYAVKKYLDIPGRNEFIRLVNL